MSCIYNYTQASDVSASGVFIPKPPGRWSLCKHCVCIGRLLMYLHYTIFIPIECVGQGAMRGGCHHSLDCNTELREFLHAFYRNCTMHIAQKLKYWVAWPFVKKKKYWNYTISLSYQRRH